MGFYVDVSSWKDAATEQMRMVLRKIALELFTRVVMRTPVDTGRLRGNWQVEIGTPSGEVLDRFDPGGQEAISEITSAVESWRGDTAIFLFNNLPYAMRVEDGWSDQAPQGMVRITLMEHPQVIEEAVS